MRVVRVTLIALLVATAATALTSAAQAQVELTEGGYIVFGFPTGDWADVAGFSMGLDGTNITRPDPDKPFAVRSSMGWAFNFSNTSDVPQANLASGTSLDLQTSNNSLWFGVGPEFGKPAGATRPFVFATAGFNIYWTNSKLEGMVGTQPYSANVGSTSTVFAWSAGAGLRKDMKKAPGGKVELSAEYHSGIGHKYVLPSEVTSSGSSVLWDRKSHNADEVLVRFGTVF
jgi:hypothetical protein